ncbi:MAG: M48 family metalloprotease [Flavobacteriaceae bacterium]|nr:M48 family metalloprotease [Flavobacteriaceae bacterium]
MTLFLVVLVPPFIFIKGIYFKNQRFKNILFLSKNNQNEVYEIPISFPFVFTAGILNPKIFLSEGLLKELDSKESDALLVHEKAHVLNKDSMIKLLIHIACFYFYNHKKILSDLEDRLEQRADYEILKKGYSKNFVMGLIDKVGNLVNSKQKPAFACSFTQENQSLRISYLFNSKVESPYKNYILLGFGSLSFFTFMLMTFYVNEFHHFIESFWYFLLF